MKTPLIALALIIATPALAAPKAKVSSLKELKEAAGNAYGAVENADGCKFDMKTTRTGLTLSIQVDKKGSVYLDVADDAKVLVTNEASSDEDFDLVFQVKGEGVFEATHADDAYDSVTIKDRNGKSLECEVDY